MVPLAKTPAWTVTVLEASRKAIMLDPAWKGGNYTEPAGARHPAVARHPGFLAARTPEIYRDQFPTTSSTCCPGCRQQETSLIKVFDANDWIYQTWAYDRHDVGTTPGFDGDTAKALQAIKAKTLILTGTKDLLNPEWEPQEAAKNIRDAQSGDHQPGHRNRPCRGRRRLPGRRGVPEPRDGGLPRSGHGWRQEARLACICRS